MIIDSPNFKSSESRLAIDSYYKNTGPLAMVGPNIGYKFMFPKKELSREEEDNLLRLVEVLTVKPASMDRQLQAGGVIWLTLQADEGITLDKLKEVKSGEVVMYLGVKTKYLVRDIFKFTEFCVLFKKDFPSPHLCDRHNQVGLE